MKWLRLLPILLCGMMGLWLPQETHAQWPRCTPNESWIPVGNGLPGTALHSLTMNGDLYVLYQGASTGTGQDSSYAISRWNGVTWSTVTSFTVRNHPQFGGSIRAFAEYKGDLYIGGRFASVDNVTGTTSLARWDGSSWGSVSATLPSLAGVESFEVFQGELVASIYQENKSFTVHSWNGTTWTNMSFPKPLPVNDFAIWKGEIYAACEGGVYVWDGSIWSRLGGQLNGTVETIIGYNNELFVAGRWLSVANNTGQFFRWDGSTWSNGSMTLSSWVQNIRWAVYDNQIYMTCTADSVIGGGGRDSIFFGVPFGARFDGTTWTPVSSFDDPVQTLAVHDGALYAGGYFTSSCNTEVGHVAMMCSDNNCGTVSGNIFDDMDADCAKGSNEKGLRKRIVEVLPGPIYGISDSSGNYLIHLPPGAYTVGLAPFLHWNQVCPTGNKGFDVTIQNKNSSETGLDFGMQAIPNIRDLRVSVMVGRARQGRPLNYVITYENVGTVTTGGTVRFFHDPRLTMDSANPLVSRYTSPVAEWDFTNLEVGESRTIRVNLTVPVNTPLGTEFCAAVEIEPVSLDLSREGRDTTCVPVTGGYDPNDIRVTPMGIEKNGEIAPEDSVLTYMVRFQNTGNDTAFKVVVVDTISSHLNIKSIKLGASSHPFSFKLSGSNVLSWTFDNIMLPDSGANEVNSHGFFKYTIHLRPNLATGTEIPNRVNIYFDYNAPVPTNTVVTTITASSSVPTDPEARDVIAYPNPAHGTIYINADIVRGGTIALQNMLGQTIRTYRHDGAGDLAIDLSGLPAGAYLVAVPTKDGVVMERITVVR